MVKVIPVIRVSERDTWAVKNSTNVIVIRLQDFVSRTTFEFNSFYFKVILADGLHKYLDYNGIIILSLVMRDDMIANFGPERYAKAIRALKPDAFTSVDGETYEGENELSRKEIERCFVQTEALMKLCPGPSVIGHVKGCSPKQVRDHCKRMKALGIVDFILHTGDFFRNGDGNLTHVVKKYAEEVRREARVLLLYGMGSPRRFLEFSFADAFITFKHFVSATHGLRHVEHRTLKCNNDRASLIIENFKVLQRCARKLTKQKKLFTHGGVCLWEEVIVEEDLPIPRPAMADAS